MSGWTLALLSEYSDICNCLHFDGSNLKELAEEYAIFEHLEPIQLFSKWDINIIKLFDISAFGNGILSNIENQKTTFYNENNEFNK